jgi:hypothetical protein
MSQDFTEVSLCKFESSLALHPFLTTVSLRLDKLTLVLCLSPRAYLEVHQQEQEKLQRQIKESKRNSRLVSNDRGCPGPLLVSTE